MSLHLHATLRVALASSLGLAIIGQAEAQTWDGGGSDQSWNTPENWNPDGIPVFTNATPLSFGGSVGLNPNLHADLTIKGLTFVSGAGAFNLVSSGNFTLTLDPNESAAQTALSQSATGTKTISHALAFINSSAGNESNISAANGDLVLDGSVNLAAAATKLTRFNANAGRTITVNGPLLGIARFVVSASGTTIINNTTSTWNNTGTGTSAAIVLSSGTTLLRGTLGTTSAGTVAIGNSGAATAYTVSLLYDSASASLTKGIALRVNNVSTSSAIIGTGPGFTSGVYNITQTILLGTSTSVTGIVGTPSANLVVTAQDANATANFSGVISNGATFGNSVTKTGPGTVILSGNNTYNGPTTVSAGRLVINGNQSTATGLVSVNANGTLGGIGTIGGAVTVALDGRLAPGNSIGTLNLASTLTLADGALFTYELGAPGNNDRINMTASALTLNNQEFTDFTFLPETGFGIGTFTLIDAGTITGSLGASTTGIINFGGTDYNAALAVSGNDLVLNVAAIPEPNTLVMAGLGLLGFAGLRLRRRRVPA